MAMGSEYPHSYGVVFACLMISVMIGGILFSMARRSPLCVSSASSGGSDTFGVTGGTSFSRLSLPAHFIAFACLLGTVIIFDYHGVTPLFWCFIGVECSYGYFISKELNLKTIPTYIRIANDEQMLEMALVENIQRENLNPIEIAISFQRLIKECNLTQEECGNVPK